MPTYWHSFMYFGLTFHTFHNIILTILYNKSVNRITNLKILNNLRSNSFPSGYEELQEHFYIVCRTCDDRTIQGVHIHQCKDKTVSHVVLNNVCAELTGKGQRS